MAAAPEQLFFLFGDSITQHGYDPRDDGWVAELSSRYVRKLTVKNVGLSGYSTDQALQLLPQVIPSASQAQIRILVIFFGANDARVPGTGRKDSPEQCVPVGEYRDNLRNILTHSRVQEHGAKIILVTPPPVDEHILKHADRSAAAAAEYAEVVKEVSKEHEVECLDIWTAFMKKAGWRPGKLLEGSLQVPKNGLTGLPTLLSDGLHLNARGNRLLGEELMELIATRWPNMLPEKLPNALPLWNDKKVWGELIANRLNAFAEEG